MNDISFDLIRFRKLVDDKGGVSEVARAVELDVSLVNRHYNGTTNRPITVNYLAKYCNYFNVSADYLFGATDVKTTDNEIRKICNYTGLNEKTIKLLNENKFIYNFPILEYNMSADIEILIDLYFRKLHNLFRSINITAENLLNEITMQNEKINSILETSKSTVLDDEYELENLTDEVYESYTTVTNLQKDIFSALYMMQDSFIDCIKKSIHYGEIEKSIDDYNDLIQDTICDLESQKKGEDNEQ